MKCIYCLIDKALDDFKKREHIVPQAFGKFKNNHVLHNLVCDDCNSALGDSIELIYARDSLDGLLRTELKVKPERDFKSRGLNAKIKCIYKEGIFKGASCYLEYSTEQQQIVAIPFPQVGFISQESQSYVYFRPIDFCNINPGEFDFSKPFVNLGLSNEQIKKLSVQLGINKSFTFQDELRMPDELDVTVEEIFDDDYRRVIGKLAFNYFAQFNAKIAVRQEFDKIRNFIRYGEDPEYWIPRIAKSQNSFLHILDDPSLKPIGHVITINKITELGIVLSELSIFNLSTYRVIISDKASNIINDIVTKGHFYNLKSKEITE
jgi:hypothetical protein